MIAGSRPSPFLPLARVLTRAAGPPALYRAVPPFAALLLFVAVAFGGNGMRPRDLCAVVAGSIAVRVTLWGVWLLLIAPAARALLETPTTFILRALPVPPWHFWVVHAAHLVALQAPWILLFTIGAGPLAGLAQGLAAAAASSWVVARPANARDLVAALALGAALVLGAAPQLLAAIAIVTGAVAVATAWTRAPGRSAGAGASLVAGSAPLALALAHVAVLVRRDRVTLFRGAAAALAGALALAFAQRNNAVVDPASCAALALAVGAIPLGLATGGVGVKILETERPLAWLLLSTGASPRLRALAAVAVTVAWGVVAGALYGGAAAVVSGEGAPRLRLLLVGTVLGASLGAASAFGARRAAQPSGVDGTAATVSVFVSALVAALLAAWLGGDAVVPIAAGALALAASTPRLVARRELREEPALLLPWSSP